MIKLVVTLKTRIKETSNDFLPHCIKSSLNSSKKRKCVILEDCIFQNSLLQNKPSKIIDKISRYFEDPYQRNFK